MAQQRQYRLGIVGASSLMGKELSDELGDSILAAADVVLLGDEESAGRMAAAADEISFIQRLSATSFDGLDFVFFTGSGEVTREHWQAARQAGASVIDLTGALANEPGVLTLAPWVDEALASGSLTAVPSPDLQTPGVVSAHPAALMLALTVARLQGALPLRSVSATLLEPVSEHGSMAMDELHQQTVNLLSFHDLPRTQYDAQIAFNLLVELGAEAKVELGRVGGRVKAAYSAVGGPSLPRLALQVVQAPVFHGYAASVFVELQAEASLDALERALTVEHVEVENGDAEMPSNLNAAGQRGIQVRVQEASGEDPSTGFWLWMAADNLKLAAANAIACAAVLRKLRPSGKVQ